MQASHDSVDTKFKNSDSKINTLAPEVFKV